MRGGFKTNFAVEEVLAVEARIDATAPGAAVYTHNQRGIAFLVQVAAGGSVNVAVEYSDDGVTWTEDTDRAVTAGAGLTEININNAQYAYYRASGTNAGTVTYGVSAIKGPHRLVAI
ncbi:hypothetical protein [Marinobacter qingdaonensis]|uniref:Uncharacterized protein n=1 Tax=Marinobacter qingdaonensis TaxID=3108486 RepID=A0ABU5NUX9_9GAMM|nr:hypothetical protein [Marinobacter sp. ASW11-75]MEA1079522.1 hypothetical protein [Marinobacter sp. ASW11-75]